MCGIGGILIKEGEGVVNEQEIINIRDKMINRGPDGKGIWLSKNKKVSLVHRRLSIIDPTEKANQPMIDPENGNVIAFNGEIYNYLEIREKLKKIGHKFKTKSDTEVILALYKQYGLSLFKYLKGMFAFSLWDQNKKCLILARDPIGIKPLYYSNSKKSIKFASQVKALLCADDINKNLSPAGNVGFFLWGSVPEPFTLFKGIKAIPNGFYFVIDSKGNLKKQKYDSIINRISMFESEINNFTKEEKIYEILRNIEKTVKLHTTSDVPISSFLSAGFDSFMVSNFASKYSDLKCLTIDHANAIKSENSELSNARLIANKLDMKSFYKEISLQDINDELDVFLKNMDQPSIDGLNIWLISKLASTLRFKVSLSGLGGDEIFGTYPSFNQIPKILKYFSLFKRNAKLPIIFREITNKFIPSHLSKKYASLFEYGTDLSAAYFLSRSLLLPWQLLDYMDKKFIEEGLFELNFLNELDNQHKEINSMNLSISALEINNYMKNTLLRDSDWAGMANSVEIRVPFADIDLIENLLKLSCYDFSKSFIAKKINNSLPNSFYNRKKTGFDISWASSYSNLIKSRNQRNNNYLWAQKVYDSYLN